MTDARNRYLRAASAFAAFDGERSDVDSVQEWNAYHEWADATYDYLGHLSDTGHYWQQPTPELDRLRSILLAQPDAMSAHPRLERILERQPRHTSQLLRQAARGRS